MAKKLKKCPVCGEKLKPMYGRMMCPSCGYSIRPDGSYGASVSSGSGAGADGSYNSGSYNTGTYNTGTYNTGTHNNTGSVFDYNTDHQAKASSGKRDSQADKIAKMSKQVKVIVTTAVVVILLVSVCTSLFTVFSNLQETGDDNYNMDKEPDNNDREHTTAKAPADSDDAQGFPESAFYIDLVQRATGKEYTKITKKEYASITSLHYNRTENKVEYTVNGGDTESYYCDRKIAQSAKNSDLKYFTGLKSLRLEGESLLFENLDTLTELEEIWIDNSPSELASVLSDCKKIKALGICGNFTSSSLTGLEDFPNLEELYLESQNLKDISGLKYVNGLKRLTIANGSHIEDISPLAELTGLTSLSLTSESIKNLSFLSKLNNLEELTLSKTKITDISELEKYADKLKKLELIDNYSVTDYSVISNMTGLTELNIGSSYDAIIPPFGNMDNLRTLHLSGLGDVTVAGTAKNITELTLERCSLFELDAIKTLTGLKHIRINTASSYLKNLHPLMALTSLETIDISNTYVFGNVEELLNLPSLKTFIMDNCRLSFDFGKLTPNASLKVLSMNNTTILEYGETDANGYVDSSTQREVNISDYAASLKNFPELEELYMSGTDIDNLDFVSELKNLRFIDVSYNYISSLEPLKALSKLEIVWCGGNTIVDTYTGGNADIILSDR